MNIHKAVKVLKKYHNIYYFELNGEQWIGNGRAFYAVPGKMPPLNVDGIRCIFEIPDDGKIKISETSAKKTGFDIFTLKDDAELKPVEDYFESVRIRGTEYNPVKVDSGVLFAKKEYLSPFGGEEAYIAVRKQEDGKTYIAVKSGLFLNAVVELTFPVTKEYVDEQIELLKLMQKTLGMRPSGEVPGQESF